MESQACSRKAWTNVGATVVLSVLLIAMGTRKAFKDYVDEVFRKKAGSILGLCPQSYIGWFLRNPRMVQHQNSVHFDWNNPRIARTILGLLRKAPIRALHRTILGLPGSELCA